MEKGIRVKVLTRVSVSVTCCSTCVLHLGLMPHGSYWCASVPMIVITIEYCKVLLCLRQLQHSSPDGFPPFRKCCKPAYTSRGPQPESRVSPEPASASDSTVVNSTVLLLRRCPVCGRASSQWPQLTKKEGPLKLHCFGYRRWEQPVFPTHSRMN